jgi:hypothetical protein
VQRVEKDLFPWIGGVPLKEITAPLLLQTLRRIESRGAHETAHTLRQTAGQVFRHVCLGYLRRRWEWRRLSGVEFGQMDGVVKDLCEHASPRPGVVGELRFHDSYSP